MSSRGGDPAPGMRRHAVLAVAAATVSVLASCLAFAAMVPRRTELPGPGMIVTAVHAGWTATLWGIAAAAWIAGIVENARAWKRMSVVISFLPPIVALLGLGGAQTLGLIIDESDHQDALALIRPPQTPRSCVMPAQVEGRYWWGTRYRTLHGGSYVRALVILPTSCELDGAVDVVQAPNGDQFVVSPYRDGLGLAHFVVTRDGALLADVRLLERSPFALLHGATVGAAQSVDALCELVSAGEFLPGREHWRWGLDPMGDSDVWNVRPTRPGDVPTAGGEDLLLLVPHDAALGACLDSESQWVREACVRVLRSGGPERYRESLRALGAR